MSEKLDIVKFAKHELNKHIFDYEAHILRNYDEIRTLASYDEWVKPPQTNRRYLYNIWLAYQEYLNGTFDVNQYKISTVRMN